MKPIYLDNHTATRPHKEAIKKWVEVQQDQYASCLASHQMGQELVALNNSCQKKIYDLFGAKETHQFLFTSSGADAVFQFLHSHYLNYIRHTGKSQIITTFQEDPSIVLGIERLEELGCLKKIAPLSPSGYLTAELLEKTITPRTSLVSISWANGLTGVIHPIEELIEVCQAHGVRLHVDASYLIGKLLFRLDALSVDFLTFDGAVLHAPIGTGGLWVSGKAPFRSTAAQQRAPNVAAFVSMTEALMKSFSLTDHQVTEVARLRDRFERGIQREFPDAEILFQESRRVPGSSVISFPGMCAEALLYLLQKSGLYANCERGYVQRMGGTLKAIGVDPFLAGSSVSFALSYETTEVEVERAISLIVQKADELRRISVC